MKTTLSIASVALLLAAAFAMQPANAMMPVQARTADAAASNPDVVQVARRVTVVRPARPAVRPAVRPAARHTVIVRPVRPWVHRPHYGRIIAGVALGTVITAAVIGTAPPPPASNLCWYWSDPLMTMGYWDYCR